MERRDMSAGGSLTDCSRRRLRPPPNLPLRKVEANWFPPLSKGRARVGYQLLLLRAGLGVKPFLRKRQTAHTLQLLCMMCAALLCVGQMLPAYVVRCGVDVAR